MGSEFLCFVLSGLRGIFLNYKNVPNIDVLLEVIFLATSHSFTHTYFLFSTIIIKQQAQDAWASRDSLHSRGDWD